MVRTFSYDMEIAPFLYVVCIIAQTGNKNSTKLYTKLEARLRAYLAGKENYQIPATILLLKALHGRSKCVIIS